MGKRTIVTIMRFVRSGVLIPCLVFRETNLSANLFREMYIMCGY